jgi:hypothetical protein
MGDPDDDRVLRGLMEVFWYGVLTGALVVVLAAIAWRFVWVGRLRAWLESPRAPRVRQVGAWFVAALLLVIAVGVGMLTWTAVDWVRNQPDWVVKAAALGPLATGFAAVVALLVGWATIVQKRRTDERDQWWKRAQWALDLASSEGEDGTAALKHKVGQSAVAYLGREGGLSTLDDLRFLQAAYPTTLVQNVERRVEGEGIEDEPFDVELSDESEGLGGGGS